MASPPEQPESANDAALDEQLVAYLDGELDEQTSQWIETRVAADPKLRKRLAVLGRTWDMLGELEQPEVEPSFTETTLERVALAAEDDARRQTDKAPRRRRRQWSLVGLSLLAAGAVGFLGAALLRPHTDRILLENLPVLEHLDEYHWVDNVEFLRELHETGLFAEEAGDES